MENNIYQSRLNTIYKQLFQYKHLLGSAPQLTLDLDVMTADVLHNSSEQINMQLQSVIAYLLGLRQTNLSISAMLNSLNAHYKKDDFWRNLLLDYIQICQEQEEQKIAEDKKSLQEEGLILYEKLRDFQKRRKEIIKTFSAQINLKKFPIDAQRLFKNYLNMADLDAKLAWDTVTKNPAYFSPLLVEDKNGKRILSVEQAKALNKELGSVIKKLKA